ncbi:thiopeptide-type bacteriocin biosynthesis protein [Streptomyces xiamenensis]
MSADQLMWRQVNVEFADWAEAEKTTSTRLVPVLERTGSSWWFIRKQPCWRLRTTSITDELHETLSAMRSEGSVVSHREVIYEPETAAFGGPAAMDTAHALFHADSRAILTTDRQGSPLGRKELSLLLCSTLLRAGRLEWYEMGDVWHRVASERPVPVGVEPDSLAALAVSVRPLLLADTAAPGGVWGRGGPGSFAVTWADDFRQAGTFLGRAAHTGALTRGLRAVLAYHIIFHWNRLGLPARTQSTLAHAATSAILHQSVPEPSPGRGR